MIFKDFVELFPSNTIFHVCEKVNDYYVECKERIYTKASTDISEIYDRKIHNCELSVDRGSHQNFITETKSFNSFEVRSYVRPVIYVWLED